MTNINLDLTEDQINALNQLHPNMPLSQQVQQYLNDHLANTMQPQSMAELSNNKITAACLVFTKKFSEYLEQHVDQMSMTDILNLPNHPYIKKLDDYIDTPMMKPIFVEIRDYISKQAYIGYPDDLLKNISGHEWFGGSPHWVGPTLSPEGEAELKAAPKDALYTFQKVHHSFMSDWIDPIRIDNNDTEATARMRQIAKDIFKVNGTYDRPKKDETISTTMQDEIIDRLKDADLYDYSREPAPTGFPFFII